MLRQGVNATFTLHISNKILYGKVLRTDTPPPPELWERVETERSLRSRPTNSKEPPKYKHTNDLLASASLNFQTKRIIGL